MIQPMIQPVPAGALAGVSLLLLAAQPAPPAPQPPVLQPLPASPVPPPAEPPEETPGDTGTDDDSRIVRGTPAPIGSSPWQISIYTTSPLSDADIAADRALPDGDRRKQYYWLKEPEERDHICGGVLITREWALSAAHCFHTSDGRLRSPGERRVRLGDVSLKNATEMAIERVVVHADFVMTADSRQYDIALIRLVPDARTNRKVARQAEPVRRLGPADRPLARGDRLLVTGWGTTGERRPNEFLDKDGRALRGSLRLLEGQVRAADPAQCERYEKLRPSLAPSMLCITSPDTNQDSCQGDSGGPLTRERVLVGLVATGIGCGLKGVPSLYTRVDTYADWIRLVMAQAPPRRSSRCGVTGSGPGARLTGCQG